MSFLERTAASRRLPTMGTIRRPMLDGRRPQVNSMLAAEIGNTSFNPDPCRVS
jgi:hypothetical protein